jgi:hypothetical protein
MLWQTNIEENSFESADSTRIRMPLVGRKTCQMQDIPKGNAQVKVFFFTVSQNMSKSKHPSQLSIVGRFIAATAGTVKAITAHC